MMVVVCSAMIQRTLVNLDDDALVLAARDGQAAERSQSQIRRRSERPRSYIGDDGGSIDRWGSS